MLFQNMSLCCPFRLPSPTPKESNLIRWGVRPQNVHFEKFSQVI